MSRRLKPERGDLLLAMPGMGDPNFDGTVVFLFEVDDDGAAGLIINRPSELAVADGLPGWEVGAAEPAVVFFGGPVETDRAAALQVDPQDDAIRVTRRIGLLDMGGPAPTDRGSVRLFAGYSGWSGEQLLDEIHHGAWHVAGSVAEDVIDPDPGSQWRRIYARQVDPVRRYRSYPDDPRLN